MAVLDILKFPDPRLRYKCKPVQDITPDLTRLIDDMFETMHAHFGLGLSAIQINRFVQLFVADTTFREKNGNERYDKREIETGELEKAVVQPVVLFNPEILKREGSVTFKEGCLSLPSYYADVKRSAIIEVQGLDHSGQMCKIKTDGLLSICIQHEIDHLNGRLFIDHLSPMKAEMLRAQIKKYGYPDSANRPSPS